MSIAMTDANNIKRLAETFGVSTASIKRENRKTTYRLLILTRNDLKLVLKELLPWLRTKKERAEIMLKFLNLKEQEQTEENIAAQIELYLKMRELNQQEGKATKVDLVKLHDALFNQLEITKREIRTGNALH
jgi:thioester reductase-like protein